MTSWRSTWRTTAPASPKSCPCSTPSLPPKCRVPGWDYRSSTASSPITAARSMLSRGLGRPASPLRFRSTDDRDRPVGRRGDVSADRPNHDSRPGPVTVAPDDDQVDIALLRLATDDVNRVSHLNRLFRLWRLELVGEIREEPGGPAHLLCVPRLLGCLEALPISRG